MRATFLPLVLLSIVVSPVANAEWSHDAGENNLICGAPDYQGRVCTGRAADGSTVVACPTSATASTTTTTSTPSA